MGWLGLKTGDSVGYILSLLCTPTHLWGMEASLFQTGGVSFMIACL